MEEKFNTLNRFVGLISSFTRNIVRAVNSTEVFNALKETISKILDFKEIMIFRYEDGNFIPFDEDEKKEIDPELKSLMDWVAQRKSSSIQTLGEEFILLMPLIKGMRMLGVVVGKLAINLEDLKQEDMDLINFISFQASIILENLFLYEELTEKSESLERLSAQMKQLLDSMLYAIVVYDKDMNEVFKNKAYQSIGDLPNELRMRISNLVERCFSTREGITEEVEISSNSSSSFYSISVIPILFENEEQVMVMMMDVSNTKELERLKRIDELKNEFIANISHELRTPLAAIKAYSETINDSIDMLDSETLKEFVEIILDQSNHLEELIDELFDFSRLESMTFELNLEEFDLVSAYREVMNALEELASSKSVKLIFDESGKIPIVADRKRVKQVLTNLIENGIKYSDPNKDEKYVKVHVEDGDKEVKTTVEDNGIGIPKEYGDKIFERFFRGGNVLQRDVSVPGTGLGLAIVKKIIEHHGGRIWFDSDVGKGTKFYFTLPKRRGN